MSHETELGVDGRIESQIFTTDTLREAYPDWETLSKAEKHKRLQDSDVAPRETRTTSNVTTDELHRYFVRNLDPSQTDPDSQAIVSFVGFGDGSANGTDVSDTDLNNRVFEESVTDIATDGTSLIASTFVDSTEANGETFNEIGLFSGNPANLDQNDVFLLNHATFNDVEKDSSRTVTFDVTLTFTDN